MIRRIRNIYNSLKNLWRWRKVIYKDRDYDHWYILEVLKTKLQHQSEYFRKHGYHESADRNVEQMELCIKLINRIQEDYYIMEWFQLEDDVTNKQLYKAVQKHNKAKRLLFKILEYRIESWWN